MAETSKASLLAITYLSYAHIKESKDFFEAVDKVGRNFGVVSGLPSDRLRKMCSDMVNIAPMIRIHNEDLDVGGKFVRAVGQFIIHGTPLPEVPVNHPENVYPKNTSMAPARQFNQAEIRARVEDRLRSANIKAEKQKS